MWRLFTNIQATHDAMGSRVILALDTHIAFDLVEWPYLQEVLVKFGFGNIFLHWVKLLYYRPQASMQVNNFISELFVISQDTR